MEQIVVSPSILSWNPHDYVYNPDFDLGIKEEWLPKYPVVSATVIESKSRVRRVQLMIMMMMMKPAFGKAWDLLKKLNERSLQLTIAMYLCRQQSQVQSTWNCHHLDCRCHSTNCLVVVTLQMPYWKTAQIPVNYVSWCPFLHRNMQRQVKVLFLVTLRLVHSAL